MAPFKALYGIKCRTLESGWRKPSFWSRNSSVSRKTSPVIRDNLRTAQSRQKSYANTRRRELSFEVGDYVYLKVSPIRGLYRFKVKGKLSPRFSGPFQIVENKGEVAYQLELPARLLDFGD